LSAVRNKFIHFTHQGDLVADAKIVQLLAESKLLKDELFQLEEGPTSPDTNKRHRELIAQLNKAEAKLRMLGEIRRRLVSTGPG
jgi:hypothetical protein